MKNVTIKKLMLTNFKGIRSLEIDFSQTTSIYGRNASGKTTIFDGFTWLLFGKNSDDKKQFTIKTIGADGKVIEKLTHEVVAILDVDGQEIRLTKRLKEKWQKKRGSAVEEFKGNEEERLYNDVPMSVKDWSEKINAICSEDSFKMITNPLYFPSLKWDKQREMLITMAGDVSTADVIAANPVEFGKLIDDLNGKSFDEYKREIGAKKKRIKEEVEQLPSRIDERKLCEGKVYDWELMKARLHHKQAKLKEVDEQLSSASTFVGKLFDDAAKVAEKRAKLKSDIAIYRAKVEQEIKMAEQAAINRYNQHKTSVQEIKETIARCNDQINAQTATLAKLREQRENLLTEWKAIKARTLVFDEASFVCPTCGRPLELDQIETKQGEMTARFNKQKAADLESNKQRGLAIKAQIGIAEGIIKSQQDIIDLQTIRLKQIESELQEKAEPQRCTQEDIDKMVIKDENYIRLCSLLTKFEKEHENDGEASSDETKADEIAKLKEERDTLRMEVSELESTLATKAINDKNAQRIKELEERLRNANEELAQLEGIEFTIQEFTKTRISMLEDKINSMFKFVRWRMYETQINGGEVETCKATVDGVPYEDLNNAMKINAGLDIINAICKSLNLTAPIFCDNAEAVNELIETKSQVIRLVVSEDENLKIA